MTNLSEISSFIWSISDSVLRNSYKRNEYQKVILPFTVLKRFDSVLEYSKQDVLDTYNKYNGAISNLEPLLKNVALDENGKKLNFYNFSKYDFNSLLQDPDNIEENLIYYLDCFSDNVKDIFENFDIKNQVAKLSKANLLYLLIKKFSESSVDLSPKNVSNHEMGTLFEELIRKFSETSNEEAGEHFTPRDVVKLMTELMFVGEKGLNEDNVIKTIYDPACGTGGMLTSCKEYITSKNKNMDVVLFGQEINPEIYAICKADMLMKGEVAKNIKGPSSTLSQDGLKDNKFDYMISNPPYGTDWEKDKEIVEAEAELGFGGRFGAGIPSKDDGQLLFIQHMLSKMKHGEKSRIAVITNGSPLFKNDAGSGESNIRKWIFENDYLEALVALPDQLFFNTDISTYIWILTNKKESKRRGKVQLIDARSEFSKMRKSLGKKRKTITDNQCNIILNNYISFEENDKVKIFDNDDFGFTKITVERPMQFNYQVTKERLENLYSYDKFKKLTESKSKDLEIKLKEENEGKQKQEEIKQALLTIPNKKYTNWGEFEEQVKEALNKFDFELSFSSSVVDLFNLTKKIINGKDAKVHITNAINSSDFKKTVIENIIKCLSEHDDTAEYVTDKKGKPKADSNLRDTEKIPLKKNIEEYFEEEVLKYYSDAWIDTKKDKVGYEINFTQYFYVYEPPRPLEEIEADIKRVTAEIQELLKD